MAAVFSLGQCVAFLLWLVVIFIQNINDTKTVRNKELSLAYFC